MVWLTLYSVRKQVSCTEFQGTKRTMTMEGIRSSKRKISVVLFGVVSKLLYLSDLYSVGRLPIPYTIHKMACYVFVIFCRYTCVPRIFCQTCMVKVEKAILSIPTNCNKYSYSISPIVCNLPGVQLIVFIKNCLLYTSRCV